MLPSQGERNPANEQRRKRHAMAYARSLVSRNKSIAPRAQHWATIWGRAIAWLLPWDASGYPGVRAGVVELLAGRSTWSAFKMWRSGTRTAPEWFAGILAGLIEARLASGAVILRELRDYRAPVHRNRGALAVDPATGRDNRGGRIGRHLSANAGDETRGNSSPKPDRIQPPDHRDLPCPKPSILGDMEQ